MASSTTKFATRSCWKYIKAQKMHFQSYKYKKKKDHISLPKILPGINKDGITALA